MPPENSEPTAPPRRTAGRIVGSVLLLLLAMGLLYGGISAITDPSSAIAGSADTGRTADTEAEAKIGGLLLCAFAISALCFGISLLKAKPAKGTQSSN